MTTRILAAFRSTLFVTVVLLAATAASAQKTPQAISFEPPFPATATTLRAFEFRAVASSGLPTRVTTNTIGVCTHTGLLPGGPLVLFLIRPGPCIVTATQTGNDVFEPATATATIEVTLAQLEITFYGVPSSAVYGDTFAVAAGTDNPGYVPAIAASGSCTISGSGPGSIVTMTSGSGDCVLTASHPGNESAEVITKTVLVPALRRPVLVTAATAWKFEGLPDPPLTYSIASGSLVFGDTFTGAIGRDAGESVGIKRIHSGNLTLGPNYALTFIGAALWIVELRLTGPAAPVRLDTDAAVSLRYTATGPEVPQCAIDWDDPVSGPVFGGVIREGSEWLCVGAHFYSAPGVHAVATAVADLRAGTAVRGTELIVYDPASSLAGEGTFASPPGAFSRNPPLAGPIAFRLDSRYPPGAATPSGTVHFEVADGSGISLHGVVQEWLVVNGAKARLRGMAVDHDGIPHGFEVTVIDGGGSAPDTLRLMVIDSTGAIAYDNQRGAAWGGDPTTPLATGGLQIR